MGIFITNGLYYGVRWRRLSEEGDTYVNVYEKTWQRPMTTQEWNEVIAEYYAIPEEERMKLSYSKYTEVSETYETYRYTEKRTDMIWWSISHEELVKAILKIQQ